MKSILLGLTLVVTYGKIGAMKNTTCTLDVNHYRPSNEREFENECFVEIECVETLFPDTKLDNVFHDALMYANNTFSNINQQGGCQLLDVRHIFIAVNGAGTNLTDIKIPLSWDMVHEVNVSHNNLTVIKNYSFGRSDMKVLDLSFNQIKNIEEKAFENEDRKVVSSISMLLLQNNKLRDLKDVRLSQESRLKFLDVSSNRIEDLSWLERAEFTDLNTIKADYNLMTKLDAHFRYMNDLRKLSLVGNSIRTIGYSVLNYLSSLEVLDLSGNDIQTLQPEMFLGLHSLLYLNMSHNKIDAITAEYFMEAMSLSVLDLSHNNLGQFALAEGRSFAPIDYLVLNDNNLTEEEIFEVLKLPLRVHHIHIGGNKFNCKHLIFRQAHEMVHNNLNTHPQERAEDMEIDCTNGDRLEKFGVRPRQLQVIISEERVVVPDFRMEENFEIMKKVAIARSSALVEVKLIRKGKPVTMKHFSEVSHEIVSHSHMSVTTIACLSALLVLMVLAVSVGLIIWKFYPDSLYSWRRLRGT